MTTTERPTGAAGAALVAVGVGTMALAVSHILAERSTRAKDAIQALGNAWMPGAVGIGPYSGKETIALIAWLGTWLVLHLLWKRRTVSVTTSTLSFLALIGIATTLLWPPITEHVVKLLR